MASRARLARSAYQLRRQVPAAVRHGRVVELLAVAMCGLARFRPAGAARADSARNAALVLAMVLLSGSWNSGRRALPGRQRTAHQVGLCERTVTRQWKVLAGLGLLRAEELGRWLSSEERAAAAADPDLPACSRTRWRNRSEFTVLIPAWASEITDEELAGWLDAAAELLTELASGPSVGPADEEVTVAGPDPAGDVPVGHHRSPGTTATGPRVPAVGRGADGSGTVTPTPGGYPGLYVPVCRTTFSPRVAARRRRRSEAPGRGFRPSGRAEAAATRPAPTKHTTSGVLGRQRGVGRSMAPEAIVLARQLAVDARFPWLGGSPRPMLAATVARLAQAGWAADDVYEQVEATLRDRGWSMPPWVIAPAAYLAVLLRDADPARPPAAARRAEQEARRQAQASRQAQRAHAAARQQARAVPAAANEAMRQWHATHPPRPGLRQAVPVPQPRPAPAAAAGSPSTPAGDQLCPTCGMLLDPDRTCGNRYCAPTPAPDPSAAIHARALARARSERAHHPRQ